MKLSVEPYFSIKYKENKEHIIGNDNTSCDFCLHIYPDKESIDIIFNHSRKYSNFNKDSFITIDDEGRYYLYVIPDDPDDATSVDNIKYCPYCGRRLSENVMTK